MARNQPVARDRNTVNLFRITTDTLFPAVEVDSSREGGHHHELSESQFSPFGKSRRGFKGILAIRG